MTRVEWYHLLKERHICPSCKRQDAYTLAGRTYCMECAEKMREYHSVHDKDPEVRKRSAARSKARREAQGSRALHRMREGAGISGADPVRGLPRKAAKSMQGELQKASCIAAAWRRDLLAVQ